MPLVFFLLRRVFIQIAVGIDPCIGFSRRCVDGVHVGDAPVCLYDELHLDASYYSVLDSNLRIADVVGHVLVEGCVATGVLWHLLDGGERLGDCLYIHLFLTVNDIDVGDGAGIKSLKFFQRGKFSVEIGRIYLALGRHPQASKAARAGRR